AGGKRRCLQRLRNLGIGGIFAWKSPAGGWLMADTVLFWQRSGVFDSPLAQPGFWLPDSEDAQWLRSQHIGAQRIPDHCCFLRCDLERVQRREKDLWVGLADTQIA